MPRRLLIVLLLTAIVPFGCAGPKEIATEKSPDSPSVPATVTDTSAILISDLIQAEDLVLDLTFRLKSIGQWWESRSRLRSLGWSEPDAISDELKTLERSQDLIAINRSSEKLTPKDVCGLAQTFEWPIEPELRDTSAGSDPLQPLMEALSKVHDVKFGVLRGPSSVVSGRDPIGSVVVATYKSGRKQARCLSVGEGNVAQNSSLIWFGQTDEDPVIRLDATWPTGKALTVENLETDAPIEMVEPAESQ